MGVAGGTAVLTGVVAAPILLAAYGFFWWKGEGAYQEQVELQQKLLVAEGEMTV
jgi:hypothetical protein